MPCNGKQDILVSSVKETKEMMRNNNNINKPSQAIHVSNDTEVGIFHKIGLLD